jgi:murein DD-endopeptidase MepM/ murein hydrolase activator NlpD
LAFESELQFQIDPNSYPKTGKGILKWPLDKVKISQYFGKTSFALANPQVYNGSGHNGIDLAINVGTPIKVSLSGVVKGFGNTDTACPGTSYGKWILVEHSNGLSTLYAHLSAFEVNDVGQEVSTGQVIGYSGNTGYSTGPHLHFTVYATQGVKIMSRKSKVCSGTYTMPVADLRAYLNPLVYL